MNNEQILGNWHAERNSRQVSVGRVREIAAEPAFVGPRRGKFWSLLEMSLGFLVSGHFGQAPLLEFARLTPRMNRCAWLFNTAISENFQLRESDARRIWNLLSDKKKKQAQVLCENALEELLESQNEG